MRRRKPAAESWLRSREGRLLTSVLAIGLGAFAIGYVLTALIFFPSRDQPPVATLPDLEGSREAAARKRLERLGLEFERASALVHPTAPRGTVLAQTPLPGQEVAPGTTVRVIVSAGRDQRAVPDVTALPLRRAAEVLSRSGFTVQVSRQPNAARAERIVALQPAAGTVVALPAVVRLVVSTGPPPVVVPALMGLELRAAKDALAAAGLRLSGVDYDAAALQPQGQVIAQTPAARDSARAGSAVSITVAGFAPIVLPPPPAAESNGGPGAVYQSPTFP